MIIEPIINSHKIKYGLLKPIIDDNITSGSKLSIYIDIESIVNRFYTSKNNTEIMYINDNDKLYMALSAELINVAAHYKAFFVKKYKMVPDIYMYYKPGINSVSDINIRYNKSKETRKANDNVKYHYLSRWINFNAGLIKVLTKYIPSVYFIDMTGVESSLAPYHFIDMNKDDEEMVHIIMTKDTNDLQCMALNNNVYTLKLKYDNSYMINSNNVYSELIGEKNKVLGNEANSKLSIELLPFVYAVSGLKNRSIKGASRVGIMTIIKKLITAVDANKIHNGYVVDISLACDILGLSDSKEVIMYNYMMIDLKRQHKILKDKLSLRFNESLVDRYDNESLIAINSESYQTNPIDILNLCMEVKTNVRKW